MSLIPGPVTQIPHASWPKNQNVKQEQFVTFNKDFKNGSHKKKTFKKINKNKTEFGML